MSETNTKAIYDKFINFIMLDGKKTVAIKIMNDTFEIIKSKGQKDPMGVFNKAIARSMLFCNFIFIFAPIFYLFFTITFEITCPPTIYRLTLLLATSLNLYKKSPTSCGSG